MPRFFEDVPNNDDVYDMIDASEKQHSAALAQRYAAPAICISIHVCLKPYLQSFLSVNFGALASTISLSGQVLPVSLATRA